MNDALDAAGFRFRCSGAAHFTGHVKRKKDVTNEHIPLSLYCMVGICIDGGDKSTVPSPRREAP
jgi:hypothetical protein